MTSTTKTTTIETATTIKSIAIYPSDMMNYDVQFNDFHSNYIPFPTTRGMMPIMLASTLKAIKQLIQYGSKVTGFLLNNNELNVNKFVIDGTDIFLDNYKHCIQLGNVDRINIKEDWSQVQISAIDRLNDGTKEYRNVTIQLKATKPNCIQPEVK